MSISIGQITWNNILFLDSLPLCFLRQSCHCISTLLIYHLSRNPPSVLSVMFSGDEQVTNGPRPKNMLNISRCSSKVWFWLLLLLVFCNSVASKSIIKTLPGFKGELPFKLETGYIGVGQEDEVQLFYYFIESDRSPKDDPLLLWLTGGPGCSGLSALFYEIGPLTFDYANSSGNKPLLVLNPYAWTKIANIIFLDAPVGTGFSYAESWDRYNGSDTLSAARNYEFLRKWLTNHPRFLTNPLYISGDSYSGLTVPIIVQEVLNGNDDRHQPPLNLKGYILGNPFTDPIRDLNSRVKFAHRLALISDALYESTKITCGGNYWLPDPRNALCIENLLVVNECVAKIQLPQILEPKCSILSSKPEKLWGWSSLTDNNIDVLTSIPQASRPWCRNYNYLFCYIWANDPTVQDALHIREGTITGWDRCNKSLTYAHDVVTTIEYHRNLSKKDLRALVYSGDHDMVIPHLGTQEWIEYLNLPIEDAWRPWFVGGQIAGYVTTYSEKKYSLTFTTIKGAGHTAPEYKPKESLAMLERWLAYYLL